MRWCSWKEIRDWQTGLQFSGESWSKNVKERTCVCQASIEWAIIMESEQKESDLSIMEEKWSAMLLLEIRVILRSSVKGQWEILMLSGTLQGCRNEDEISLRTKDTKEEWLLTRGWASVVLTYLGYKIGEWLKNIFILQFLLTQELMSLNFWVCLKLRSGHVTRDKASGLHLDFSTQKKPEENPCSETSLKPHNLTMCTVVLSAS